MTVAATVLRRIEVPALWVALIATHVVLGVINLTSSSNPFGDVTVVYFDWVGESIAGAVPAIDVEWVYPILALIPMLAAASIAFVLAPFVGDEVGDAFVYGAGWLVVVFLATALLVAWLTRPGLRPAPRRMRLDAAWWLVALTIALGPIATGRIDAITLPIAVAGIMLLRHRPALAGVVLAIGAWVKVWPAAPFLAALIGRADRLRLLGGGAVVTGAIVAIVGTLGGWPEVASFVAAQTGRGLQIEAPAATIPMLFAANGDGRFEAAYDTEILTVQITGPGTAAISSATTPLMVVLVAAISVLGVLARRSGASMTRLVPPLALAIVLALIVTNKVGSPQFVVWVIAIVVAWLVLDPRRARLAAVVTVAIGVFTQLIYPWNYPHVMTPTDFGVTLLVARNALYVALLALAVWQLVRALRDARRARRDAGLRAADTGEVRSG